MRARDEGKLAPVCRDGEQEDEYLDHSVGTEGPLVARRVVAVPRCAVHAQTATHTRCQEGARVETQPSGWTHYPAARWPSGGTHRRIIDHVAVVKAEAVRLISTCIFFCKSHAKFCGTFSVLLRLTTRAGSGGG